MRPQSYCASCSADPALRECLSRTTAFSPVPTTAPSAESQPRAVMILYRKVNVQTPMAVPSACERGVMAILTAPVQAPLSVKGWVGSHT